MKTYSLATPLKVRLNRRKMKCINMRNAQGRQQKWKGFSHMEVKYVQNTFRSFSFLAIMKKSRHFDQGSLQSADMMGSEEILDKMTSFAKTSVQK